MSKPKVSRSRSSSCPASNGISKQTHERRAYALGYLIQRLQEGYTVKDALALWHKVSMAFVVLNAEEGGLALVKNGLQEYLDEERDHLEWKHTRDLAHLENQREA